MLHLTSHFSPFLWHHYPEHDVEDESAKSGEYGQKGVSNTYQYGVKVKILCQAATDAGENSVIDRAHESLIHNGYCLMGSVI